MRRTVWSILFTLRGSWTSLQQHHPWVKVHNATAKMLSMCATLKQMGEMCGFKRREETRSVWTWISDLHFQLIQFMGIALRARAADYLLPEGYEGDLEALELDTRQWGDELRCLPDLVARDLVGGMASTGLLNVIQAAVGLTQEAAELCDLPALDVLLENLKEIEPRFDRLSREAHPRHRVSPY